MAPLNTGGQGRGSARTLHAVIAFAALNGPVPKVGVIVVALAAAGAMLIGRARLRALAMLGALVLSPLLLLADIWHSPQLRFVHHHPLFAVVGAALGLAVVAALAAVIARRAWLLAPLAIVALPFRIPIHSGGATSNLLVPLYLVVAAGALAVIAPSLGWFSEPEPERAGRDERERALERARRERIRASEGSPDPVSPGRRATPAYEWVQRLLAGFIVLYAVQASYSSDFRKALQQMVFFYVPFTLLLSLLRDLDWNRRLISGALKVAAALAVVFAGIGFVEYATKSLLVNPKLIAANELHTYFTVNSVFFDPDIFGRFLALVMIALAGMLLYASSPRLQIGSSVVLAILWGGLVLTLSRSSMAALLVGLGVLAALRWKSWPVLAVAAVVVAIGSAALAISPKTFGLNQGLNGASSGRANLVSGGISLFGDRPLWGYGSGSFVTEYRAHHRGSSQTLSASHTIPITIGAEQGLIGELAYLALVLSAQFALLRGTRADPVRGVVCASFLALVFHTMLYADFLEDPVTWTLLAIGIALARAAPASRRDAPSSAGAAAVTA
jgi:putative inorganic carbon (hco3(-)) transporter